MDFIGQDYLKTRIKQKQKFLVSLLNLHIGSYFPLRKWLGIAYKGKIDEVSHLSFAYNTKYFKDGRIQQTRDYQHPDLGWKLNLVLDRIPQLILLPALLQPTFRLASVLLFSLTTTTYQPPTKDTLIYQNAPTTNYGSSVTFSCSPQTNYVSRSMIEFVISDIPAGAVFSAATLQLYYFLWENLNPVGKTVWAYKLTRTDWVESQATWNIYKTGSNWTTAGGDYVTSNPAGGSITVPASYGWLSFDTLAIVQDAYGVSNPVEYLMKYELENTASGYWVEFRSKEYTTDTTLRPKLTVTYTVTVNDSYAAPAQSLILSQPVSAENYDYQLAVLAQALTLSQKTPAENYDYQLAVLAQPLIISNSSVIDSYSESNYSEYWDYIWGNNFGAGQSFTGNGSTLDFCKFYLSKYGLPTGNAVAKIYLETHESAFGTNSLPTGDALATSDNFDVSTLTTDYQLITFNFSGANKITLTNGTYYVVTVEYSGGDINNHVCVGADAPTPTHSGNECYVDASTWYSDNTWDEIFYVYGSNVSVTYDYSLSVPVLNLLLSQPDITLKVGVDVLVSALALSLAQQNPTVNYDYLLNVSTQSLTLSQKELAIALSASVSLDTLALALAQLTPSVGLSPNIYPSALALSLSQYNPSFAFGANVYPSVLALALTQKDPSIALGMILYPSALALTLTQKDPTFTYDYALYLDSIGILLSQKIPWYHWWSKEPLHQSIWIPEIKHS